MSIPIFRVKLATIKYIGECLCSTCIISKNQVRGIGTRLHDIVQSSKLRVDSQSLQHRVQKMRELIFEKGQLVNGSVIDRGLPYSIIPVNVSLFLIHLNGYLLSVRMPFRGPSSLLVSTSISYLHATLCMNLNLAYGRVSSLTSSECYMC